MKSSLKFRESGYLVADSREAYSFGTADFTAEAWVKTLAGGTVIGRKSTEGGRGNGGFLLVVRPDSAVEFITDDGLGHYEFKTITTSVCDGMWHHVAAVRMGPSLIVYVDGVALAGTPEGNRPPPLNVSNDRPLTIGTVDQKGEPYRQFTGSLAEIRLWSLARSALDIATARGSRLPADSLGLVGYWPAELGQTLDFSRWRTATRAQGTVASSTDAPPVGPGDGAPPMTLLFSGSYDSALRQGAAPGAWTPTAPFLLTSMGYVVQDNEVKVGVTITGNTVTWSDGGNTGAASITFRMSGTDSRVWPDGPRERRCFEGSFQPRGGTATDWRGVLRPALRGCGLMLNVGSGLVVDTPGTLAGAPVTLAARTARTGSHYCVYDSRQIRHMTSDLAISVRGKPVVDSAVVLDPPADDQAGQSWVFGNDGLIRPAQDQSLALTAAVSPPLPARLTLAAATPADPAQQFLTLENSQPIWNSQSPNVLVAAGDDYTQASATPVQGDEPCHLWYSARSRLINAVNGKALTVSGPAVPGAAVALARASLADPAQAFGFDRGQLVHLASGLPVKMAAAGGTLLLGGAGETGAALTWTMALSPVLPPVPSAVSPTAPQRGRSATVAEVASPVEYVIEVTTGASLFAGTDDKVEVELVGDLGRSGYVELTASTTFPDPFERGQFDRFNVTLPNVGRVAGIDVRYGANNWFWSDHWEIDGIRVHDLSTRTTYWNWVFGPQTIPGQTLIRLPSARTADARMSVGMAPTLVDDRFDHTWNEVTEPAIDAFPERVTYFNNAGGHGGPGATDDIITAHCALDLAVRMATGDSLAPGAQPKAEYGTNDVDGKETCGIRASGRLSWDGQCHNMTNRLLYMCTPSASLDDLPPDKQPRGYGLLVFAFGPYGLGFERWCSANGFPLPPTRGNGILNYLRTIINFAAPKDIALADRARLTWDLYWLALDLQKDIRNNQPPDVTSDRLLDFVRRFTETGLPMETIAHLVGLPLTDVTKLTQEEASTLPRQADEL